MALVNHAKKEINAKVVYYGPAGSGKRTALTYIYSRIKPSLRGELRSVPAGADNLLFFDFSPFDTPLPNGYRLRLHVYTLTGIVTNPATWKMTLKGADGIVILVNPVTGQSASTRESVAHLRDYLSAYGVGLHETPAVLQLNSFTPEIAHGEAARIAADLDLAMLPACHSNAARGEGLLEALTSLSRQVLGRISVNAEPPEPEAVATSPSDESAASETIIIPATPPPADLPNSGDSPQIHVVSHDVVSESGTVRIPLTITVGDTHRRFTVSVSIDPE